MRGGLRRPLLAWRWALEPFDPCKFLFEAGDPRLQLGIAFPKCTRVEGAQIKTDLVRGPAEVFDLVRSVMCTVGFGREKDEPG